MLASPHACALLIDRLPCYESLIAPATATATQHALAASQHTSSGLLGSSVNGGGAGGGDGSPSPSTAVARWQADAVLGAQLAFLLPLTAAAAPRTPHPPSAASALLPYLLLLTKHPQGPVALAAHGAFAGLVTHIAGAGPAGGWGGAESNDQQQQQQPPRPPARSSLWSFLWGPAQEQHANNSNSSTSSNSHGGVRPAAASPAAAAVAQQEGARLVEHVLPYYVERSLEFPWEVGQLEGLQRALPQALGALPPGSPVALHCLRTVAGVARAWLAAHPHAPLDFSPLYGSSSNGGAGSAMGGPRVDPAVKLLSLVCSLPLSCDWQLLPAVVAEVEAAVAAAAGGPPAGGGGLPQQSPILPPGAPLGQQSQPQRAAALLQHLHDVVLGSNDYARKSHLVPWVLRLREGVAQRPGTPAAEQGQGQQEGHAGSLRVEFMM